MYIEIQNHISLWEEKIQMREKQELNYGFPKSFMIYGRAQYTENAGLKREF